MKGSKSKILQNTRQASKIMCLVLFWAAVSGICANAQSSQSNRIIGLVKEISGEWSVAGSTQTRLTINDSVPPGGKIISASGNYAESRIVISLFDGAIMEAACRSKGKCNSIIQLPKSLNIERPQSKVVAEDTDFFSRARRVFESLWRGGSKNDLQGTITRGSDLKNAVVKIADGRMDLSPALKYLKNGTYFLRLCPAGITDNKQCEQHAQIISLNLINGIAPILPATGISPGAYRLILYDFINQQYLLKDEESIVYLCPAEKYESLKTAYEEANLISKRWGNIVEPSQAEFLREYLIELAKEEAHNKQ